MKKLFEILDVSVVLRDIDLEAKIANDIHWAVTIQQIQALHPAENCSVAHLSFMLDRAGTNCHSLSPNIVVSLSSSLAGGQDQAEGSDLQKHCGKRSSVP